jgi:hypothetical protein
MGKEQSDSDHLIDDDYEFVEPHIIQGWSAPEPQSKKKCEECKHFLKDLTLAPCWDCYPSRDKKEWEKNGHKNGDSEPEQVDREDSGDGAPYMQ